MTELLLGVFSDPHNASQAIQELEAKGFDTSEMSVILKDTEAGQEIEERTGASVAGGAASGATTGGVLGAVAGLLVGIGAIAVPGVGALLIGGPIAAAFGLTGAAAATVSGAVTGALAGGLVGALIGLGVPKETAEEYEREIQAGGVLLIVPVTDDTQDDAREILSSFEAGQMRSLTVDTYGA